MHQRDKLFIDMLNKIWIGLKDECIESSHNIMLLNELSTEEIEIHAIDTIPTSCNLPECLITAAQNKHSDTSGPAKTKGWSKSNADS